MTAAYPLPLTWAQQLIDNAEGPVPQYGSPEWQALPDDSRAKVAATVIAAECWRTYWLPEEVERRLRTELEAVRNYEEPEVWSPDVVASVHRTARQPSYADLSRLRGEPEAEARANVHRRRMGLPVVERDAPTHHIDGRPVKYRAPLRLVPGDQ